MYFSKYKQSLAQKFSITIILVLTSIYLFELLQRPRSPICLLGDIFTKDGSCNTDSEDWNIFYHLGGNGPWIPMKTSENHHTSLPSACHVEQVHMLARHAERYPTRNAGAREKPHTNTNQSIADIVIGHTQLLSKLRESNSNLRGPLAFFHNWSYFAGTADASFEDLTSTGPYAGVSQAQDLGVKLRTRYGDLVNIRSLTKLWACSSPRDVKTARFFAAGFFGRDWEKDDRAKLQVIPETPDRGADTLTPGRTCPQYREDKNEGRDRGYTKLAQWQALFSRDIARRLKDDAGAPDLTAIEIYGMMELCGFEILARGSSPWCDVFSHKEWLDFEYARDVLHYYRAGPGNKYAGAIGWLWLNATKNLLASDGLQDVFFSFVHDSDIVSTITALGLLEDRDTVQDLPVDHIDSRRIWRTSSIVPMSGHLVFEKIVCKGDSVSLALQKPHIRLFVNDGLYDLRKLTGSGGEIAGSTTLEQFSSYVLQRGESFGSFNEVCGLGKEMPDSISFLQQ